MTRECKSDYALLSDYITSYSISQNLQATAYVDNLKNMHKCYFALITWNAELNHAKADFLLNNTNCNVEIILRLTEVVSDIRSALFNWINGSYKTSRIMIRTGLENFVRAVSAIDNKAQLVETNVYKLFENADEITIFKSQEAIADAYSQLHSDYKILCSDTHTATIVNMEQLSSLAGLPSFEKRKAADTKDIFVRVVNNMNTIFCLHFNSFYHSFHHRNKENIAHALSKESRALMMDPKIIVQAAPDLSHKSL